MSSFQGAPELGMWNWDFTELSQQRQVYLFSFLKVHFILMFKSKKHIRSHICDPFYEDGAES